MTQHAPRAVFFSGDEMSQTVEVVAREVGVAYAEFGQIEQRLYDAGQNADEASKSKTSDKRRCRRV